MPGRGKPLGDHDKAIEGYTEALQWEPTVAMNYEERGLLWYRKKEYTKAADDFGQAIKLGETAPHYVHRAAIWYDLKEYPKCASDLEAALRLDANHIRAMLALAQTLAAAPDDKVRNGKRAIDLAGRAHKLDADNAACMEVLAAAHAEVGDFDNAKTWQQKALDHPKLADRGIAAARLKLYQDGQPFRLDRPIVIILDSK